MQVCQVGGQNLHIVKNDARIDSGRPNRLKERTIFWNVLLSRLALRAHLFKQCLLIGNHLSTLRNQFLRNV